MAQQVVDEPVGKILGRLIEIAALLTGGDPST
jgi:hypothetical protein